MNRAVRFLLDHDIWFDSLSKVWYWGSGHDESRALVDTLCKGCFGVLLYIYGVAWSDIRQVSAMSSEELHSFGLVKKLTK